MDTSYTTSGVDIQQWIQQTDAENPAEVHSVGSPHMQSSLTEEREPAQHRLEPAHSTSPIIQTLAKETSKTEEKTPVKQIGSQDHPAMTQPLPKLIDRLSHLRDFDPTLTPSSTVSSAYSKSSARVDPSAIQLPLSLESLQKLWDLERSGTTESHGEPSVSSLTWAYPAHGRTASGTNETVRATRMTADCASKSDGEDNGSYGQSSSGVSEGFPQYVSESCNHAITLGKQYDHNLGGYESPNRPYSSLDIIAYQQAKIMALEARIVTLEAKETHPGQETLFSGFKGYHQSMQTKHDYKLKENEIEGFAPENAYGRDGKDSKQDDCGQNQEVAESAREGDAQNWLVATIAQLMRFHLG